MGNTLKRKNFIFLKSVSKKDILNYIQISDYALVNLKKSKDFLNVIPSKIFENIALYKPILLGVDGEAKKLIQKYKVGIAYKPENIVSFLEAINKVQEIDLKSFKINCQKMISDYDRDKIAEEMMEFIKL